MNLKKLVFFLYKYTFCILNVRAHIFTDIHIIICIFHQHIYKYQYTFILMFTSESWSRISRCHRRWLYRRWSGVETPRPIIEKVESRDHPGLLHSLISSFTSLLPPLLYLQCPSILRHSYYSVFFALLFYTCSHQQRKIASQTSFATWELIKADPRLAIRTFWLTLNARQASLYSLLTSSLFPSLYHSLTLFYLIIFFFSLFYFKYMYRSCFVFYVNVIVLLFTTIILHSLLVIYSHLFTVHMYVCVCIAIYLLWRYV